MVGPNLFSGIEKENCPVQVFQNCGEIRALAPVAAEAGIGEVEEAGFPTMFYCQNVVDLKWKAANRIR